LTVYVPGFILDGRGGAGRGARGAETLQDYLRRRSCAASIEAEQGPASRWPTSRRGAARFEGLHEIANDPEYLAEWSAQAGTRGPPCSAPQPPRGAPRAGAGAERS